MTFLYFPYLIRLICCIPTAFFLFTISGVFAKNLDKITFRNDSFHNVGSVPIHYIVLYIIVYVFTVKTDQWSIQNVEKYFRWWHLRTFLYFPKAYANFARSNFCFMAYGVKEWKDRSNCGIYSTTKVISIRT